MDPGSGAGVTFIACGCYQIIFDYLGQQCEGGIKVYPIAYLRYRRIPGDF
jgi:hypothetical protein